MRSSKKIHFFSSTTTIKKNADRKRFGIRGRQIDALSKCGLPIAPGIIIEGTAVPELAAEKPCNTLKSFLKKLSEIMHKTYGSIDNPLLLSFTISSNNPITQYPTLYALGLTTHSAAGVEHHAGTHYTSYAVLVLLQSIFQMMHNAAAACNESAEQADKAMHQVAATMQERYLPPAAESINQYAATLPAGFFDDAEIQMQTALYYIHKLLVQEAFDDVAVIIQPYIYGTAGSHAVSGKYYSRDIITGKKTLQGVFFDHPYTESHTEGTDIQAIQSSYLIQLESLADRVEEYAKDMQSISFTIEGDSIWLLDQQPIAEKSSTALVRCVLDLYKQKTIDAADAVNMVQPEQLTEILHPVVNPASVQHLPCSQGGIAGAVGAAVGRIYFSADALIQAQHTARKDHLDTCCILCVPSVYAGDVKAIEAATGVLTSEGGYAAHASVVARQYGKISLVRPDIHIAENKALIDNITIHEGDLITLHVPYCGKPRIYFGKAELIEPNIEASGLPEFITLTRSFIKDFHVRANADSISDAETALKLGADGIGLCRTEHMFFKEDRINIFRHMVISRTLEERNKVLQKLQKMQEVDFYGIFKVMKDKPVTIRLLDAPLHEFLPHGDTELNAFIEYLHHEESQYTDKQLLSKAIDALAEVNPMLGHRGCRAAISYPEIYAMQIRAIFEAAYTLQKENINPHIEIMVPFVMNIHELKQIIYGKRIEGYEYEGIASFEQEIRAKHNAQPATYSAGAMIEVPAAALCADEIARYARFFSFGTNDLTQTALGLSRDDFNTFMPDYTLYDLIDGNPFECLHPAVKQLISTASQRGKVTRPDIKMGLCGEHGANPETIPFCIEAGLHYVSCSPYAVPIALLSIAHTELKNCCVCNRV